MSITHIKGTVKNQGKSCNSLTDYYGQMEPYKNCTLNTGALIAHSLVNTEEGQVPVRVVNVTDEPITLYRSTLLGMLRPVDLGERINTASPPPLPPTNPTPQHNPSPTHPFPRITPLPTGRTPLTLPGPPPESRLFSELKLDKLNVSPQQRKDLESVCWENKDAFSLGEEDIGCCNFFQAHIELKENANPRWVPSRPIPYKMEAEMDRQISSMLCAGTIEECRTNSGFNSPVFLVPKSNGDWRFVCDLRQANLICQDDFFALPNLNNILDRVGDSRVFSVLDFRSLFNQIEYTPESRHITAFSHKGKRYNFVKMTMGHKVSTAKFTRMIQRLLATLPIEHISYFVDDIICFTPCIDSHIKMLGQLFRKFREANLKLSPKKCHLLTDEVSYVGITLTKDGVRINEQRSEAIQRLEAPRNLGELQSVMGTFVYNKRFIRGFSDLAAPLYPLLRRDKRWNWTPECQEAFEALKHAICNAPCLAFPDIQDPLSSYEVTIDGSLHAYGAYLTQMIQGERRVVAYFSKKVPDRKRAWAQGQLEFETLYQTVKHWGCYLRGADHFWINTDCKALLAIDTIYSKTNSTAIRKLQELANYRFTVRYISGSDSKIAVADMLSRYQYPGSKLRYKTPQADQVTGSPT